MLWDARERQASVSAVGPRVRCNDGSAGSELRLMRNEIRLQ